MLSDFASEIMAFEDYLANTWASIPREKAPGIERLLESMDYSLKGGGKRFRPLLAILTAEALGKSYEKTFPYALAVEMVHTYSLIHDDLPMMDNDSTRRGKPTNHVVYGEPMALLAGDALQSEAFVCIAENYQDMPELALRLVTILSQAASLRGMVGGQAIDIHPITEKRQSWEIRYLHNLKTGALMRAAIDGAVVICNGSSNKKQSLGEFGKSLGLAFQIADDIQDAHSEKTEPTSFITVLGQTKTIDLLHEVSKQALGALQAARLEDSRLSRLVHLNLERAGLPTQ